MTPWARILKQSRREPNGCLVFLGRWSNQYGHRYISVHDSPVLVHRISWTEHFGEVPAGLCVLHRCDTPACIEPTHLFLGTQADNNADMRAKGRAVPPPIIRGFEHWAATLTDAQVAAIRADRTSTQRALAREYGVSQATIWRLKRRETRAA